MTQEVDSEIKDTDIPAPSKTPEEQAIDLVTKVLNIQNFPTTEGIATLSLHIADILRQLGGFQSFALGIQKANTEIQNFLAGYTQQIEARLVAIETKLGLIPPAPVAPVTPDTPPSALRSLGIVPK